MKDLSSRVFWVGLAVIAAFGFITRASAQTRTIRIVTYNIEADTDGDTAPLPGLIAPSTNSSAVQYGGVLEGIGEEIVGSDPAQPLDILALEETTSNTSTVAPIVNGLNTFYNVSGMYAMSTYQATSSGGTGGGPNALVYNTRTLQLLASTPVNPPAGESLGPTSGESRQVVRYEFAPAGLTPSTTNEFYVYVSHYKSGTTTTDAVDRAEEAAIIRNDEASNLTATVRVIYVGDYNVDNSGEAGYQTILSNASPTGIHQGQGIDPLNVTNNPNIDWSDSTTNVSILVMLTEHSYNLEYRDDLQVMTTNVYFGAPNGLKYVPGTYHAFGNNGTTAYGKNVNNGTDTALSNVLVTNGPVFISAAQLYLDLTNASDHLPVVADYTIPLNIPAPGISGIKVSGSNVVVNATNGLADFTYTLLQSTNIQSSLANWTPVATNFLAVSGSFVFTLTNTPSSGAFYILAAH